MRIMVGMRTQVRHFHIILKSKMLQNIHPLLLESASLVLEIYRVVCLIVVSSLDAVLVSPFFERSVIDAALSLKWLHNQQHRG